MMVLGRALLAIVFAASLASLAAAQSYPDRPVKIIVAYGPGTVTDVLVRLLADKIGPRLNQSIVVENRGGAGGVLAATAVAQAAPDGYTLLAHTMGGLGPGVVATTYDPVKAFAGIAPIANLTTVIVGAKGQGFSTLPEMIALGKSKPGFLNYASTGTGSPSHMYAEKLKAAAGFEATNVPYKGVAEAIADLSTGRIHFFAFSLATALPVIRDGKVIPLAITSARKPAFALEFPTVEEVGLTGATLEQGVGLWAPKATPREIVERLNREVIAAFADPAMKERLAAMGATPWEIAPDAFDAHMVREIADTQALVSRLGLRQN